MARRQTPRIPDALLGGADPKTAFDANGLLDDLKKALAERALNAEVRLPGRRAPDPLHHQRHRGPNSKLRRAVRARGHFPTDDAAMKLLFLVLKEWKMPPREWCMAKAQFAVIFGERFTRAMAA